MKTGFPIIRKLLVLLLFIWSNVSLSQAPQRVNYQTVIRNNAGELVKSHAVRIKVSILQGSASGAAVYIETHTPNTNANGLATVEVGNGTPVSGSFSSIQWGTGTYYLKVETDPTGGTTYSISGTSQILSVPYALYSRRATYVDNENDPLFSLSVAAGITQQDTANWNNNSYGGILDRLSHIENALFTKPSLTTSAISSINITSAIGGGNISNDGGMPVLVRGVCWNTTGNPTIAENHTENGGGTGVFSANLTGLAHNTTYYVRAYATNGIGTSYGNQVTFTTLRDLELPVVSTNQVSNIARTTAYSGGNVTSGGTSLVTARGVCWNTTGLPSVSDDKTIDGAGTGAFVSILTLLEANTTYHIRAYATNNKGTSYGNQVTFTTLANPGTVVYDTITDSRDGKKYRTLRIGAQTWMADNLAFLPKVYPASTSSETDTYYYVYGYNGTDTTSAKNTTNYTSYGVLYNWPAAMNGSLSSASNPSGVQGVCPTGWHLPSDAEWTVLGNYLIASAYNFDGTAVDNKIAKSMASLTNWNASTSLGTPGNDAVNNNSSGFTGLPAGSRTTGDTFSNIGIDGNWWSSYENGNTVAWSRSLSYNSISLNRNSINKSVGYNVRCVKNDGVELYLPTLTTSNISELSSTTAVSGGNISSDGGAQIASRGVCWSTSPNPTTANSKTTNGEGTGSFLSNLTGLNASTTYYVKAYATNSVGTAYGNQITFTTLAQSSTLPSVVTTAISNISQTTATGGGNVTSQGTASVTARGICWSTSQNPTIANSKTTDGTGTGIFASNLTGLSAATTYYVRAYATSTVGTAYGDQISFTTAEQASNLPVVTTSTITNITQTTATGGGNVTSQGGSLLTAKGICWSTSANPTIDDSKTTQGTTIGTFTSNLTGLLPSTTYYVRAYATNSYGTAYGGQVSFSTTALASNTFVDPRDSKIYNTITIGSQTWMAENLAYLPAVNSPVESLTNPLYFVYGYTGTNVTDAKANPNYTSYGALYNWVAASTACPTGWTLPTTSQWSTLRDYLIATGKNYDGTITGNKIAKSMSDVTGWDASSILGTPGNESTTNNSSGFKGLPGGYADYAFGGSFTLKNQQGSWWTSSASGNNADAAYLLYNNVEFLKGTTYKAFGYSVRCIKVD